MSALLPTSTSSWMLLQEIVGHTQQSPLCPQSISIRVHLKSLIGMPYAHSLHGHPHPASRTLSMSPPGMELHHIPRITSRNTLSLEILSSTSPDAVKLLQQTPSSLTPLLLMMVQPWPNVSVAVIPLSVMHMASNQPNNSLTPSLITSEKRGAMDTLISDGGKYEISKRVTDLFRSLFIQDYQSEPYHQHQNKAENRFGLAKRYTNTVMNTSGCTACCWLLCLQYICVVLNHLASPTLQGICPVQALEGTTPDISFLLHFSFYEPVYYRIDSSEPDLNFPSSSNEKKGYWVGFADNQGDSLTWRILTEDTQKIIIRSGVRSALRSTTNQRLASPSGEGTTLPFLIPYPQQSQNSLPLDPLDASTSNFEHFPTLQGICPVQALEGTTPDISFLLHFSFYEPVYYRIDSSEPDLNFPSSSNEKKGYWVGFADNQGDSLTWRILTEDTQKIIIRSGVRSALRSTTNQRLASPSGEGTTLPFLIPYPQQSQNSLPLDPLDASTSNFEHFPTLQGICPVQALEGTTPDISFLLHFSFYEPVYYRIDSSEPDLNFPSSSNEKKGYWVGFADNQGDSLTWRILTEDTQKIIIRSGVQSALRSTTNQRLASPSGEGTTLPFPIPYPQQSQNSLPLDPLDASTSNFEHFVKSQPGEDEDNPIPMANIDIPNLLGRSFLLPPEDNGERHMAKVIDIDDHGQTLEDIKFKLKINKDQAEEIMFYNQLMDYIQKGTDAEEDPD